MAYSCHAAAIKLLLPGRAARRTEFGLLSRAAHEPTQHSAIEIRRLAEPVGPKSATFGRRSPKQIARVTRAAPEERPMSLGFLQTRRIFLSQSLSLIFLLSGPSAKANDEDDAVKAATAFVEAFSRNDPSQTFDQLMAPRFKSATTKDLFIEYLGVSRLQLGGPPRKKNLVGSQHLSGATPGTATEKGSFYYVRNRVLYPISEAFFDVYLEHTPSGWLVTQFTFIPVPPGTP